MTFRKKTPAKTALVYAVDLLAARPYSTKQLYNKLKRRGYDEDEIDEAVSRLLERHYLDDSDLCQRQCRIYIAEKRLSLRFIRCKLREKGFDPGDIEDGLAEACTDDYAYECESCARLLRSHFKPSSAQAEKCMAYLYRKGFNSSAIRAAVSDFLAQMPDFDE